MREIGIYGLGRFGSFYASQLAGRLAVKAYTRNPERPVPAGVARIGEDELLALPVVILCVAISALPEVLRRIAPRLRPGTLVMDTCSVKTLPSAWMREELPPGVEILATHPMFGPDSAGEGLSGLPLILCPVRVSGEKLEQWRGFFSSLGLKVLIMDPDRHDREAAFTQGLTHYLGRVLYELDLKPSSMASVGYQRLLQIIEQTCNDSWQLFLDLQQYNPYTKQMRRALDLSLRAIDERLRSTPAQEEGLTPLGG